MAMIEVNHRVLRDVASAINTYCSTQDREMNSAKTEINSMFISNWIGLDAQEFRKKWATVDSSDSTTMKFRESLKNFSEGLTACANLYEKAQADAYNEANKLPKIIYW